MSSASFPGLGKVFRAEAVMAVPVGWLHRELFERMEQMPQWNPALSQVKVRWGGNALEASSDAMAGRHHPEKKNSSLLRLLRSLRY